MGAFVVSVASGVFSGMLVFFVLRSISRANDASADTLDTADTTVRTVDQIL